MPSLKFTIPIPLLRQPAFYLTTITVNAPPSSLISDPNPDLKLAGFSVTLEELSEMYQVGSRREKLGKIVELHLVLSTFWSLHLHLHAFNHLKGTAKLPGYFLISVHNKHRLNKNHITKYIFHQTWFLPLYSITTWCLIFNCILSRQKRRCPTRRREIWSSRRRQRRRPPRPLPRWVLSGEIMGELWIIISIGQVSVQSTSSCKIDFEPKLFPLFFIATMMMVTWPL